MFCQTSLWMQKAILYLASINFQAKTLNIIDSAVSTPQHGQDICANIHGCHPARAICNAGRFKLELCYEEQKQQMTISPRTSSSQMYGEVPSPTSFAVKRKRS
eukprot:Colp12_sorted_trinity150504_noHs@13946